jgi:protein-tyrosine phosphatase
MFKKYFQNANIILDKTNLNGQLWLGNYKAALDPEFIKNNNISVIVNVSVDIPYIYDIIEPENHGLTKLETFRIPVEDSQLDRDIYLMEKYFHTALPFLLKKLLSEHKNVLVQCAAGKQRSAILVSAFLFLVVENGLLNVNNIKTSTDKSKTINRIIAYMIEKRPCVFRYGLKINFKTSLENFFNIKL